MILQDIQLSGKYAFYRLRNFTNLELDNVVIMTVKRAVFILRDITRWGWDLLKIITFVHSTV